jgi:transcriptional regulator with XRE-family HTH domain
MTKLLTQDQVIQLIRDLVHKEGSQSKAARKIGISAVYIGKILKGKELPGQSALNYFGLEREIVYRKK